MGSEFKLEIFPVKLISHIPIENKIIIRDLMFLFFKFYVSLLTHLIWQLPAKVLFDLY